MRLAHRVRVSRLRSTATIFVLFLAAFGIADVSPAIPAAVGEAFLDQVEVTARIAVGTQPGSLAAGKEGVWVTVAEGLALVDPADDAVARFIAGPEPFAYAFVAESESGLWVQQGGVSTTAPQVILRMDPVTGSSSVIAAYEGGPHGLAVGLGSLWAIDISGVVTRIDLVSGAVLARININGPAWGIDIGPDAVWVAGMNGVTRIDPETNAVVATIDVPYAADVAAGPNLVWVTGMQPGLAGQPNQHGVFSIDPRTNLVIHRTLLPGAYQLDVGEDVVWVVSDVDGDLVGLDPLTGLVAQTLSVAPLLADVLVMDGTIWVAQGGLEGDLFHIE